MQAKDKVVLLWNQVSCGMKSSFCCGTKSRYVVCKLGALIGYRVVGVSFALGIEKGLR